MPKKIEVPGIGIVEFPDGMSDDQIVAAIKANTQAQKDRPLYTGVGDVAAGVGSGLVRGGAMVAGQGGDIVNAGQSALANMTAKPVPPNQAGPQQPGATAADIKSQAIAAMPAWLRPYHQGNAPDLSSPRLMREIDAQLKKYPLTNIGPVANYQPTSRLGSVGQTAASFVPTALATKTGVVRGGALPGAVSEIAGQSAEGTGYETPARIGGAVLGGSVPNRRPLTQDDLRMAATAAYQSPAVTGLRVDSAAMPRLAADVQRLVDNSGVRPYSTGAGPLHRGVQELGSLQNPGGLSVADIRPFKKTFGVEVEKNRDPMTGRLDAVGASAAAARKRLSDYLANVPPRDVVAGDPQVAGTVLRFADQNWTQAQKMAVAERARELAERRAGTGGSGKNITNVERQEFRKILNNRAQEAGLSEAETAALERAVMGTKFGNLARTIGNQYGGSGMAANVGTGIIGAGAYQLSGGDPWITGATTAGFRGLGLGARAASNASQAAGIRRYEALLAQGSPLASAPEVRAALNIPDVTQRNAALAALLAAEDQTPPSPLRITVRPPPREPTQDYPY